MALTNLKTVQVATGITFGQECYLDPARTQEFLTQVNNIFPNFFTRNDFQQLPNGFVLENSNGTRRCIAQLNSFNYSVVESIESTAFLHEVEKIFDCFRHLFALKDVRRIGKTYDLHLPANFEKNLLLSNILRIDEPAEVNNLQLLFREEGKNINIHFHPIDKRVIEFAGNETDLEPGVIIRCDINNIDTTLQLKILDDLKEIFGFADRYVRTDLVNFLNKYFGDRP